MVVGEDGFRLPGEVVVQAQGVFAFGVGAGDAGLVARGMALRVVAVVDVARAFEARLAVGEAAGEAEVAQGFDGVCANVVAVAFEAAVVAAVGFFAADAGGDAEGEVAGDAVADADAELVVVCFAVAGFQGVVVGEAAADGGVGFALAQGTRVVVEQFAAGVLVRGEGRCRDGAVGVVRDGVGKVLVDGFFGLCVFRQVGAVFQRVVAAAAFAGRAAAAIHAAYARFAEIGKRHHGDAVGTAEAADVAVHAGQSRLQYRFADRAAAVVDGGEVDVDVVRVAGRRPAERVNGVRLAVQLNGRAFFCFLGGQRAGGDDFAVNVAVIERTGLRDFSVGVVRVAVPDDAHRVAAAVEIFFAGADRAFAVGFAVFLDGGGDGIDFLDALTGIHGGSRTAALLIGRGAGDDRQRGEHLQN